MLAELIKGIFDKLHLVTNDFNLGFFAGVGLALILIILILLFQLVFIIIFRQKKCSGITIAETDGETFISKSAISSLIMHLENDFPLISVKKLLLYKCRKNHILKLYIEFNDDGTGLPPQSKKLRTEICALLNHTFGIKSIKKIVLDVKNATIEPKNSKEPVVKLVSGKIIAPVINSSDDPKKDIAAE